MLEKYFKTLSEKFAIPFIKICIFLKIKPNVLSVIGLFTIILGSYSFLTSNSLMGLLLIFLGSAIDGLDGPLARTLNAESLNINNKGGITQRPERVIFAVLYMYYQFSFIYVYIFSMLTWLTVLQRFLKIYKSKL